MSESVGNVVVSLIVRSSNIIFITFIVVVLLVHWSVSEFLRPLNIVMGHLRSLLGEDRLIDPSVFVSVGFAVESVDIDLALVVDRSGVILQSFRNVTGDTWNTA